MKHAINVIIKHNTTHFTFTFYKQAKLQPPILESFVSLGGGGQTLTAPNTLKNCFNYPYMA